MKRKLISLVMIFALALSLASCGGESAPTGMKAASDSSRVGYKLYVPEEWTVSNLGNITAAYVSSLDSSSISLVEAENPEGTLAEYFEEHLSDFPTAPQDLRSENALFGNATEAIKYTYNLEHTPNPGAQTDGEAAMPRVGFMQVLIRFNERFFIFTYSALLEKRNDEATYYEHHLPDVQAIMDNAFFTTGETTNEQPSYEVNDGFKLISDKSLSGFSLYVPESYAVTISSGIVTAESERGAVLTVMKMTVGQIYFSDYWELRRAELAQIFGEVNEISKNTPVTIGNVSNAYAYEYSYVYSGVTYRVYQVFLATGSGYAFTMTAPEEVYDAHRDELGEIMEKIVFE